MKFIKKLFIFLLLLISLWILGLNQFIHSIDEEVIDTKTRTDAIVVLTGGSGRLAEGIYLLYNNMADELFISGVGKDANIASLLTLTEKLPANIASLVPKISLGYEATSTQSNAIETQRWLKEKDFKSIRLVTSNYHMRRSVIEFKNLMPDVTIIKHPVKPERLDLNNWWQRASSKKLLITEYNKYLITKIAVSI